MRALVTGATGFVGRAIVGALEIDEGFEILALGGPNGETENLGHIFQRADITDIGSLRNIKFGADVLVHTAGLAHQFKRTVSDKEFFRVNCKGTENVLELALRLEVTHFILISSVSVYGSEGDNRERQFTEDARCNPVGGYARSKFAAESASREFCSKHGIDLTILRPATVIGEGDPGNVSRLIRTLAAGRFVWVGNGENYKSLIYKDDLANACLLVLKNSSKGAGTFNISGPPMKMNEIVAEISGELGGSFLERIHIPSGFLLKILGVGANLTGASKVNSIRRTVEKWVSEEIFPADSIRKAYGFVPQTALAVGLRRQVKWILKE